jgi:hypothetical protein
MSEQHAGQSPQTHFQPVETTTIAEPAHSRSILARLAALHDEALETAELANLVGRTPWAAALVAGAAMAAFAFAGTPVALAWALLGLACAGGLLVLYAYAMRAPFQLNALRAFHDAIRAALMLSGAVWGGIMLVALGPKALIILAIFVLTTAGSAAILRLPTAALAFAAPAILAGSLAAILGPGGALLAFPVLAAGLLIVAGTLVGARLSAAPRAVLFPPA